MFYQSIMHAGLLFGTETWILLAAMAKNLEGVHMDLLIQETGQTANRQRDDTWRIVASVRLLKEARTHTLGAYIGNHNTKVEEWVMLRPILEV